MKRRAKQPKGLITNLKGDVAEILIYDDIGPEWAGMISAKGVTAELARFKGQPRVNVRINSPGGDVVEGLGIYNALARFDGQVDIDIDGLAASMASVIAMAGDTIRIAANGMMMVHRAWTVIAGNEADLRRQADLLVKIDENLRDTYAARTEQTADKVAELMEAETWMTAQEAIDLGFADEIGQELQVTASVRAGRFKNTPAKLLEKVESGEGSVESEENEDPLATRHSPPTTSPADFSIAARKQKLALQRRRFAV